MELVTPRLRLRLPREDDAPRAHLLLNDPDVLRWNPARPSPDVGAAKEWCLEAADWSSGNHASWHAERLDNAQFVANVSLFAWDHEQATAKIGYRVMPDARGRGIASEAVSAVATWAFADRGLARIQLEHAVPNAASCRVAQRAGFRWEGTLRSSYLVDGVRCDEHVHGRLAGDDASEHAG